MKIIATLPPPHTTKMKEVVTSNGIDEFRLNTGVVTPYNQFETLKTITRIIDEEKLWIDVKGTQLRIDSWAVPEYSELIINREIEVDLPAIIYFRHEKVASQIVEMKGRKLYVDPLPVNFVGAGQAINIHGNNYKVKGNYLTVSDAKYITAGKELGINNLMLSFLESQSNIDEVLSINPCAKICGKIETPKGLELIKKGIKMDNTMFARDDYFINSNFSSKYMFEAQKLIIEKEPNAIAASRILTSLEKEEQVTLSDLADIYLLKQMGYSNFMLSDGLSKNPITLRQAISILRKFEV